MTSALILSVSHKKNEDTLFFELAVSPYDSLESTEKFCIFTSFYEAKICNKLLYNYWISIYHSILWLPITKGLDLHKSKTCYYNNWKISYVNILKQFSCFH